MLLRLTFILHTHRSHCKMTTLESWLSPSIKILQLRIKPVSSFEAKFFRYVTKFFRLKKWIFIWSMMVWFQVRCRQFKLRVNFFWLFFTSFDAVWAADHENLFLSLRKCFLLVEKYEILQRYRFWKKTHFFRNMQIFLLFPSFPASETNFSRFNIKNWT